MVNVVLITLLFGCSPALAALLAPPKALRTREEWLRIKSADDVLTALDCSDITLARTVELSEEILTWSGILSAEDAYKDMDVGLPLRKLARVSRRSPCRACWAQSTCGRSGPGSQKHFSRVVEPRPSPILSRAVGMN